VPYRGSWFSHGASTRWIPLQLAHPGVWRSFDILWALGRAEGDTRTAQEFIEARGYRGRARELAALTLTAHLPGSVDEVAVGGLAADGVLHLEGGTNYRVVDGYDGLATHLARGLDIRHGARARTVSWAPDGVTVRLDSGQTLGASAAVSTIPHGVLASGKVRFTPGLPTAKARSIDRIATGPVGKVVLVFDEAFWSKHMTQLVCGDGPVTLYWPTSYGLNGPANLIAYATGPRARKLFGSGPDAAVDIVLSDLRRHFPSVRPELLLRAYRVVDWSADPDAAGGYTFLPPRGLGARADLAAPSTGALFWAGSATEWSPVADTVEAAFLSGIRAAGEAVQYLERSGSGRLSHALST
jgi:monoamine oxidase